MRYFLIIALVLSSAVSVALAADNYSSNPNLNSLDFGRYSFKLIDRSWNPKIPSAPFKNFKANGAPVANKQSVNVQEDSPTVIVLTGSDIDNDVLTFMVVNPPTNGTLTGTGANLIYTSNLNYTGPDSFTFKVNDGTVDSSPESVSISVKPVNDTPVANNQVVSVIEDSNQAINLTGSDVDGDYLIFSIVSGPTNGTLVGTLPNLTYTPNLNYNGPDTFTFIANDGTVDSDIATVSISVTQVNDPPIANNLAVSVLEDTPTKITGTGTDVDGDPLTYSISTAPSFGTLSVLSDSSVIYTPNLNYSGHDSFTFIVNDGTVSSSRGTVFITVTPVNDAPVSYSQSINVTEDVSKNIVLAAFDVDADPLTFSIVTAPSNGTLSSISGNRVTYTPDPDYHGSDSFTFRAHDGSIFSSTTTISVTVTSVNDVPISFNQAVQYDLNNLVNFTLKAWDVEGDPLTYSLLTIPSNGTLSGLAPDFTYTPDLNFFGSDSFTFKVNDGVSNSDIATVTINGNPGVNVAPIADNQSVVLNEDENKNFVLGASDANGDPLTYSIISPPTNGSIVGIGPVITYVPNLNYNGSDSFTFRVNDGAFDSNIATVSLNVLPVNDPPVANDIHIYTFYDNRIDVVLTATDVEGNPLSYTLLTLPTLGNLTGTPPNLKYGYLKEGVTSFTYKVSDGTSDSNIATVTITLISDNDEPIASNLAVVTNEDISVSFRISGFDKHDEEVSYLVETLPSNGTLSGTAPNLTYTPHLNYYGADSFTFKVNDGVFDSNTATVSLTVNPVNDAPIAYYQTVTVLEGTAKGITPTGSDVDGDPITFAVLSQPLHGTLAGVAPNLTYTPNPNFYGLDSFTFKVNDGLLDSEVATISIKVIPIGVAPVAYDQIVSVLEDNTKNITLSASDFDEDPLTFIIVNPPAHGVLSGTGANVSYTPDLNYFGPDAFTFKANDGVHDSNVATVQINVLPVNDPPEVVSEIFDIDEDTPTQICVTVTDIEGDPSKLVDAISRNGNGTIELDTVGGKFCFIYTPNPDFNGLDIIDVTVCDNNEATVCGDGTITINVLPVNDPPIIKVAEVPVDTIFLTTPEETAINFCFEVEDIDGDNTILNSIVKIMGSGSFIHDGGSNFCFTYSPIPNFTGRTIWDVGICDDGIPTLCTKVIVVIDVAPALIAFDQIVEVLEDTPKPILLSGSDPNGDALSYLIVANPTHGTLSGSGAEIIYTPALNYNGPDSFTFKVNDGTTDSNIATVSINVFPINDPPVITVGEFITYEDSIYDAGSPPKGVCLNVVDVDGDIITYEPAVNVKGGGDMVLRNDEFYSCYILTPPLHYNGESIWDMSVSDGTVTTTLRVKIILTPVNDPPVGLNDYYQVRSGVDTAFNALENDLPIMAPFKEFYDIYEADSVDEIRVEQILEGPYNGTASISSDGFVLYKSKFEYMGVDSIRYRMCDSQNLCDTAVIFIEVVASPFKIWQAVSPNNDNLNEYWRIDGIEEYPKNLVRVFDRYNNLVFETKGYKNDQNNWRGQSNHGLANGNLPEGTYFYSVDLGNGSGLYSGFVILKLN